jgi:hypothetical protein
MLRQPQIAIVPADAAGREVDPESLSSEIAREGYRYWLSKRGIRAFPARTDIHPAEIKSILPNIILVKVLERGGDFQFRVVGEAVAEAHGLNPINWRVSELDRYTPGFSAVVMPAYRRVFETHHPYASCGTLRHLDRGYRAFETVILPLGPASDVDHLFIVAGFSGDIGPVQARQ